MWQGEMLRTTQHRSRPCTIGWTRTRSAAPRRPLHASRRLTVSCDGDDVPRIPDVTSEKRVGSLLTHKKITRFPKLHAIQAAAEPSESHPTARPLPPPSPRRARLHVVYHQLELRFPTSILSVSMLSRRLLNLSLPNFFSPPQVTLVRHGQSTWNEEGRIQGSSNTAVLTAKGEAQAETTREMLQVGPGGYCSTRHPSHFEPSSFELKGIL